MGQLEPRKQRHRECRSTLVEREAQRTESMGTAGQTLGTEEAARVAEQRRQVSGAGCRPGGRAWPQGQMAECHLK